jgi:aminoglycoside phosphotransferase (APT) family kinase protein
MDMDDEERHDIELLVNALSEDFGGFDAPSWKPYSVNARSTDGAARLKVYRGISPRQRQARERAALAQAPEFGILVPRLVRTGSTSTMTWSVFENVAGVAGQLDEDAGIKAFAENAADFMARLRTRQDVADWPGGRRVRSISATLEGQISRRARTRPWWPDLSERLRTLDPADMVRLHGDIKPEHFITNGPDVHVVDWEAATVGPAVLERADFYFHAVRDLTYARRDVPGQLLKFGLNEPVLGAALAWRVVLWVDRRRAEDIDLLPRRSLIGLLGVGDEAQLIGQLAELVAVMSESGTPR